MLSPAAAVEGRELWTTWPPVKRRGAPGGKLRLIGPWRSAHSSPSRRNQLMLIAAGPARMPHPSAETVEAIQGRLWSPSTVVARRWL